MMKKSTNSSQRKTKLLLSGTLMENYLLLIWRE